MPGVGKEYFVAHVAMRKIPLASWSALGVGTSGKQRPGVLITPYFKETRSANPQVFPNEQHPFNWKFNFKGQESIVSAISDRQAPGIDVIYLKNELYQRDIGNMTISEGDRVDQIENFIRPSLEVISHIPHVDAVNCHGVETSLLALLIKQDPRFSQIKVISTLHNIDDERIRDFSPDHFVGKTGFDLLIKQNWLSFFGGKVSMLGTAVFFSDIAMAINKDTVTQLGKSGYRSAEFFKDMVRRGKLSYLLEPGQENLETRAKGKLVVDFSSKALRMIDRYGAAIEYSREGIKDFKRAFLVNVNQEALQVPVEQYAADLKGKIAGRLGDAIAGLIHVFPKKKEGSGSSIVHMLEEAVKYMAEHPGEEPPVIYLDVDGENVTLFDMSLAEVALRQVSYLLPQLRKEKDSGKDDGEKPKEAENWFFVKGNTTIALPAERQRIGAEIAKYSKANILIFGRPIDPEKLKMQDPDRVPKYWGVIFTNKKDGRVTRIMEKPSHEEVKAHLDSTGDEGVYFNLSNYAFSEKAAKAILSEYSGESRNEIGFADTYRLHIVKHIFAPMVMAPDEEADWNARWNTDGFDAAGDRIDGTQDWLGLFQAAQRVKKACGDVVLVGGGGTFIDIRQGELRKRLERAVAEQQGSAEGQVIREIFNPTIPEKEELSIIEEEESLPEVIPIPEPAPAAQVDDRMPWELPPERLSFELPPIDKGKK